MILHLHSTNKYLKRFALNIAAILAVCAVFGVKAADSDRRAGPAPFAWRSAAAADAAPAVNPLGAMTGAGATIQDAGDKAGASAPTGR